MRSGGVAGARLSTTVESGSLAAEEERTLRSLIAASGLGGRRAAATPGAPADRLQYHLTVEEGGRTIDLRLGEDEVPSSLRPLLAWLTDRARGGPRSV